MTSHDSQSSAEDLNWAVLIQQRFPSFFSTSFLSWALFCSSWICIFRRNYLWERELTGAELQSSPHSPALPAATRQASPLPPPTVQLISELQELCLRERRWRKVVNFSCKFTLLTFSVIKYDCLMPSVDVCFLEAGKHDTLCTPLTMQTCLLWQNSVKFMPVIWRVIKSLDLLHTLPVMYHLCTSVLIYP